MIDYITEFFVFDVMLASRLFELMKMVEQLKTRDEWDKEMTGKASLAKTKILYLSQHIR